LVRTISNCWRRISRLCGVWVLMLSSKFLPPIQVGMVPSLLPAAVAPTAVRSLPSRAASAAVAVA